MVDKPCPKCEMLPRLPETEVNVILFSEIDFLLQKLSSILSERSINHTLSPTQILVPKTDLHQLLIVLDEAVLSEAEQEELKVGYYSAGNGENFLSLLPRLKPLKTYLALLHYADYLRILEGGHLTVYYHPIVDLGAKGVFGFECLIRGVKSNGDLLSPAYLFNAARETNTLFYLDRLCREVSIKTSAVKGLRGKKVFINFLPTVIYDPKFCLQSTIKWAYQLEWEPTDLVFEVVETEKVKDMKHLRRVLDYYRENGFNVALDDVGTGYSSLDALLELEPNFIKISRELIQDIESSPIKRDLLKALVDAVQRNGIEVIAEGIERPEEAKALLDLGVSLLQGFLFAKPNPEPIYEVDLSWLD